MAEIHDVLRERLLRQIEALPDEQVYQVLDYMEFLNSKYARSGVRPASSPLQKFNERLEDRLRINQVGIRAIRGALGAMGTADKVFSGISEAGRSLIREVETGLKTPADEPAPPRRAIAPPAEQNHIRQENPSSGE